MAKSIKKLLKSFTLIELIIVIAIIAVLGVAAFLVLTQWMSKGRDAQRISDMNVIQNALNIQIAQADTLPIPDNYNIVKYTGEIVLYQGKFGSGVVSNLRSLTKVPQDKTNGEYEYSLLSDRMTYKIQAIMENSNYKTTFVQGVFADELYYRYVGKDLRGIIIGNDFVYLPNMFLTGYVNGQYDLGSGMNVFLGNKVGEYVSGGIVDKNDKDGIIAMMTGLGLSINDATSILSKATGVVSTTIAEQPAQPEDTSWCYYASNELSDAHAEWNSTELKYDTDTKKCYIFGDEDANAKAACNKWVTDNVTQGGEFVWVPARWFVTDGIGTDMKDNFYQRAVSYNGKDYVCRGFAIAKHEITYKDLSTNPSNSSRNTYSYLTYTTGQGGFVSKPGYPIANINQGQAISACRSIGTNYHLITNNEWMASARNIEQQGVNWSSGVKGTGGVYRGISEADNYGCSGKDTDNELLVPSTNLSCTRRILRLSNSNSVWDITGNVWEHVDRGNTPNTLIANLGTGSLCVADGYWYTNGNPSNSCANNYGPIYNKGGSDIGMGYVYNGSSTDKIFIRGAGGNSNGITGIFSLAINQVATTQQGWLGFRCVR